MTDKREGLLLFEAVGEIPEEYVLDAAFLLEGARAEPIRRRKLWRTLLIAAALSALFIGTAFAAGMFGLTARLIRTEPTATEPAKTFEAPNGLGDSAEARATAEWFDFYWDYQDAQTGDWEDYSASFAGDDYELRQICQVYNVYDETMADELTRIAGQYGLELYTDQLALGPDWERFKELSGAGMPFLSGEASLSGGYIFPDGSFKIEGFAQLAGRQVLYSLHRNYPGALYPFNGPDVGRDYEEWACTNARGDQLGLARFAGDSGSFTLYYNDPAGEVYLTLSMDLNRTGLDDGASLKAAAEEIAEALDIGGLTAGRGSAGEILARDRDPASNPEAAAALAAFQDSAAYKANREFETFFTETFYGDCFTGVYGQEGYGDIDEKLEELGREYGLRYARSKSAGNAWSPQAAVYDNGAWFLNDWAAGVQLHVIPKDALYTPLYTAPAGEQRQLWSYETRSGAAVTCMIPMETARESRPCVLYEAEDFYALLFPTDLTDAGGLEQAADAVDFAQIEEAMK